MRTYDEPAYANDRLAGTIVRLGGKAIKIKAISAGGETSFSFLVSGRPGVCLLKDIDITPVPLGFVNFRGLAHYLSRCPVRKDWKQGLRTHTMRFSDGLFAEDVPYKQIGCTIEGDYPALKDAITALNQGNVAKMAFCRNFAIDAGKKLYYKAIGEVGELIDLKDKRYRLNDNHKWIQETLEEAFNA